MFILVSSLFFSRFVFFTTCNSILYNVKTLKLIAFFPLNNLNRYFFFNCSFFLSLLSYENFSMFKLNSFGLFNFTFLILHTQRKKKFSWNLFSLPFVCLFVFLEFDSFQTYFITVTA